MKAKKDKYYLLDRRKYYFSVNLQRKIKFSDVEILAVKCGSSFGENSYFGTLVDTSSKFGPDYDTNNEIEFSDNDIEGLYSFKDMPLLYSDIMLYKT